eukprot:2029140-Prymnesium_polylepis.1
MLCSKGAAINQAKDDGETPLHVVCVFGHLSAARTLSSYGAQRLPLDMEISSSGGHAELAAWLTLSR